MTRELAGPGAVGGPGESGGPGELDTPDDVAADLREPGFLEPSALYPPRDMPDAVVLCFLPATVRSMGERPGSQVSCELSDILEPRPLWEREHRGRRIGWTYPSIGAPHATMVVEELIARGVRRFVAVGSAGVLVPDLVMGHPFVVTSALRDEGTSGQYGASGAVVEAEPLGVAACRSVLSQAGVAYAEGRTWTTDAIYRETRSRTTRRIAQGCAVVDMEASALQAVAKFRGASLGQLVFSADSLAGDTWDARAWSESGDVHEAFFWLGMDIAARLVELTEPSTGA